MSSRPSVIVKQPSLSPVGTKPVTKLEVLSPRFLSDTHCWLVSIPLRIIRNNNSIFSSGMSE